MPDLRYTLPFFSFSILSLQIQLILVQAEFSYKVKPKLPQQFKAAEQGGVPFAVILGEDEMAAGKVRIKEMGLEDGHPEKEGVLVDLTALPTELKTRLDAKKSVAGVTQQLEQVTV